ncbi:Smr domain-containing protein [Spathaspora sp. JA1]|nr:Smr domain-containing protein [Spathaspora sp. JA1]
MTDHTDTQETTRLESNNVNYPECRRLRREADRLYTKGNQLTQESQTAYKSDDEKLAYELAEQAKQTMNQASSISRLASEHIFRLHNKDKATDEIDLRGLFVKEATWYLKKRISQDVKINQSRLRVIVGRGVHSANRVSKLKPAVQDLCKELKLKYQIPINNNGLLVIALDHIDSEQISSLRNLDMAPPWSYDGTVKSQNHPESLQPQQPERMQPPMQQEEQHYEVEEHSGWLKSAALLLLLAIFLYIYLGV